MKYTTALILFLVSSLAVWAQQPTATPATDSSAVGKGSEREPIPSARGKDFWDGDDPNLVNLVTHPFANKAYVQRHVGPIRDRISELEQLSAENSSKLKDVDSRAQQGIRLASEKTDVAEQHSSEAINKAQLAQTAANQASTRVSATEQIVGNLDRYKGTAQTEIRFRPGQSVLSKNAKDALDDMAGPLKNQKSYIVEVRGFAPGRGQSAITSSRKMADSVVRYLVLAHNIPVYRIYTMSMGNAEAADGKPSRGRVEVSVLRNDLVSAQK